MSGSQTTDWQDKLDQIHEEIALAVEDGEKEYAIDPNSYATGLFEGKAAGLFWVLNLLAGPTA